MIVDWFKGLEVCYFVIDAGWYKLDSSDWSSGYGDWVLSKKFFL